MVYATIVKNKIQEQQKADYFFSQKMEMIFINNMKGGEENARI
jgi:hypothetical protein